MNPSQKQLSLGVADEIKGEAIAAFVILKNNQIESNELIDTLKKHVSNVISPIAKPSILICTLTLPKTRSGKIMRRILRQIIDGETIGDTTTLASPEIIKVIKEKVELS